MANDQAEDRGIGHITTGVEQGNLVFQAVGFVRTQLPAWRDDPHRQAEQAEERLNSQLCKFLNSRARHDFPMVYFHHEEFQTGRRRVDLSVLTTESSLIGARMHSIYDPFLVFEGKRLPAPTSDRQIEYVSGNDRRNGGIQRFKLRLHGATLEVAGMIGYLQDGSPGSWHQDINQWIAELASGARQDVCAWASTEVLGELSEDKVARISWCRSDHARIANGTSASIRLHHLWVLMGHFAPAPSENASISTSSSYERMPVRDDTDTPMSRATGGDAEPNGP